MLKEIKENSEKDAVYCITTHDFVHKNIYNFKWLINTLKKMQKDGLIKNVNVAHLIKSK
jgi:hypothetical protein